MTGVDGKKRKALLEDGYQEAGYRSGWQVLCNSAAALVASFLWNANFVPTSVQAAIARLIFSPREPKPFDNSWCPLSPTVFYGSSRTLMFVSLG